MARATDWIDTVIDRGVSTGAQDFFSLMMGVAPVNVRRQTLIRTIISIDFTSNTTAGAYGVQQMSIGIGITSQEAFAVGVFPDPITANDQPSRGWIYRTRMAVAQNGVGGVVVYSLRADIRSQRKLDDGECYFVIDNTAEVGLSFEVHMTGLIRQLWLLP